MTKATLEQGSEILQMLLRGDYDREWAQAVIEKRVVVKPPAPSTDLPPHHFRITVEKTDVSSYADLKSAYDWVSDTWDESKFKLELHESLRELTPSTGDKVVFLKKFDRTITSDKAIAWAKSHGYRLAFPSEREAFSKAHPDFQRKFWIVDLGSFIVRDGRRSVPVLYGYDGRRDLDNGWFDREWGADYRFLFVRE